MIEQYKLLATQAQNLKFAAERQIELMEKNGHTDAGMQQMINQFFEQIYETLDGINKGSQARIAPEQVDADQAFRAALEDNLKRWKEELESVQKRIVDVAIKDVADGQRSQLYQDLEDSEKSLRAKITEAEVRLGQVTERIQSPGFNNTVNQIVNNAKP